MADDNEMGERFAGAMLKLLEAHGEAYPGATDDAKALRSWMTDGGVQSHLQANQPTTEGTTQETATDAGAPAADAPGTFTSDAPPASPAKKPRRRRR